jgi:hypothetical protein
MHEPTTTLWVLTREAVLSAMDGAVEHQRASIREKGLGRINAGDLPAFICSVALFRE